MNCFTDVEVIKTSEADQEKVLHCGQGAKGLPMMPPAPTLVHLEPVRLHRTSELKSPPNAIRPFPSLLTAPNT